MIIFSDNADPYKGQGRVRICKLRQITSLGSPFRVIFVENHANQEMVWLNINLNITGATNEHYICQFQNHV